MNRHPLPTASSGALSALAAHADRLSFRGPLQNGTSNEKLGGLPPTVDGKPVIFIEPGGLIIGDVSPNGFKPALRPQLPARRRVRPTVADGRLFCRNAEGALVAQGR